MFSYRQTEGDRNKEKQRMKSVQMKIIMQIPIGLEIALFSNLEQFKYIALMIILL